MQLYMSIASFAIGVVQLALVLTTKPRGRQLVLSAFVGLLLLAGGVAWFEQYQDSVRVAKAGERIVTFLADGEQTIDGLYDALPPADFPYVADALSVAMERGQVQQHLISLLLPDGRMIRTRSYYVLQAQDAARVGYFRSAFTSAARTRF